jgi:hypothetical protein
VLIAPGVDGRAEAARVASVQPEGSLTLDGPLAASHTAAQADTVHPVIARFDPAGTSPTGAEVTRARSIFWSAASDPAAPLVRYEKVFWRNNHPGRPLAAATVRLADAPARPAPATAVSADCPRGSSTLFVADTAGFSPGDVAVVASGTPRAECVEIADVDPGLSLTLAGGLLFDHPASAADPVRISKAAIAAAESADDAGSVADRLTPPAGLPFGAGPFAFPGGVHAAGSSQGVWVRLRLEAGDPPLGGRIVLEERGLSW